MNGQNTSQLFGTSPFQEPGGEFYSPGFVNFLDTLRRSPEPRQVPPPDPTKKEQDAANEYLNDWLRRSQAVVDNNVEKWKWLEYLYKQRVTLKEWEQNDRNLSETERQKLRKTWQTNEILSINPMVDAYAHRMFQAVFFSRDYLQVTPRPDADDRVPEDHEFPTSKKLEELCKYDLKVGQFRNHMFQAFQWEGLFGFVFMKAAWYSRQVPQWWAYPDEAPFRSDGPDIGYPLITPIKPHNLLPDPEAVDADIQRWSGICHCKEISYHTAKQRFESGVWHLNRDEFERQFAYMEGPHDSDNLKIFTRSGGYSYSNVGYADSGDKVFTKDVTAGSDGKDVPRLKLWETQGLIPTKNGWEETVTVKVTDRDVNDPSTGILVRMKKGYALDNGMRTFACAHFMPLGECYGQGIVEPVLGLIHQLSTWQAIITDNAKLATQVQLKIRANSPVEQQLRDTKEEVQYPGKVWVVDEPDDLDYMSPPALNSAPLVGAYQHGERQLEKRTGISDATLGMSTREKTATETIHLQHAVQLPVNNLVSLCEESLLYPLGKLIMGLEQQHNLEDRHFVVKNAAGEPMPIRITAEEIQSGQYDIEFVLDRQDQFQIAKLQSLTQFIPVAMQMEPLLMQAGKRFRWHLFADMYMRYAGIDRRDELIADMSPDELMAQQQTMMEQMGMDPMAAQAQAGMGGVPPSQPGDIEPGPRGIVPDDPELLMQYIQEQARPPAQANAPIGGSIE